MKARFDEMNTNQTEDNKTHKGQRRKGGRKIRKGSKRNSANLRSIYSFSFSTFLSTFFNIYLWIPI